MTNANAPFFYCPAHRVRFRPASATIILCEQGSHEVGNGFPSQSWWTYCCDCSTFWPAEFSNRTISSQECLVCDRVIDKLYLCATCQVVSVESSTIVRRKSYFIDEKGIEPNCPACQTAATICVNEHNCPETGLKYLTARTVCAFCQQQLGGVANKVQCCSCSTELVAPFKFCKRCGQAQEQNSEKKLLALPVVDTEPDADDGNYDHSSDFASDTALNCDSSEQPETEEEHEACDQSYSQLDEALITPPKRRVPWLFAVIALAISAGVLLPVFALYGDPRKPPERPAETVTVNAPAGMVFIAGGEFLMGTDDGDEYERPSHKETVSSFFMDVTEVTCEDYQQFVRATGHRAPLHWSNNSYPAGAANLPVTGVDWYDADAYAKWAKKRLPTEQEWEFAARSNDGRRYPWGNHWSRDAANAGDSSAQRLVSVASFPKGRTPSGLMDLAGNAWEWTSGDLVAYPKGKLSEKPAGEIKIVRGGSWQEPTNQVTTTYRGYLLASGAGDYSATGFRCVSEVRVRQLSKEN